MEYLFLDHLDDQAATDHPGRQDRHLTLRSVGWRKEILVHLDPQDYQGKMDKRVTKEMLVLVVTALVNLDYPALQGLKESEDPRVRLEAKEKRVVLAHLENLEHLVLQDLLD